MTHLEKYIDNMFKDDLASNIAICVGNNDNIIFEIYRSKE